MTNRVKFQGGKLVAASLMVAACSGGGGGSNGPIFQPPSGPTTQPPPPPPVTSPDVYRTDEFNRQWGLGAIGAEHAYAAGYNGKGVIIGFVDFNFDLGSGEVAYRADSVGINQRMLDLYEIQIGDASPKEPHGHAVAAVAAAKKNGLDTHGVAYGSTVLAVDYFSNVNSTDEVYNGVTYHVSNPWTYLTDRGAKIVSISIGYDEEDIIENPPTTNPDNSPITEKYSVDTSAHVMDQGGLLIAAAGNNGHPDPQLSLIDMYNDYIIPYNLLSGSAGFLVVGALDQSGEIADFSDRAGRLKDYYIVAPGVQIVGPWTTEDEGAGLYYLSGTSFAAPHVAGAAAVLMSKWPTLTPGKIADILMDTATDLGAPGVDEIYGHGALNLEEAIKAQGLVGTSLSSASPIKVSTSIKDTGIRLGAAFGDVALPGLDRVMGIDKYGRDFYYNIDANIVHMGAYGLDLQQQMQAARQFHAHSWSPTQHTTATMGFQALEMAPETLAAQSNLVQAYTKENRLQTFQFSGKSGAKLSWHMGYGNGLYNLMSGHLNDGFAKPYMMTDRQRTTLIGGRGFWAMSDYNLNDETRLTMAANIGRDTGQDQHALAPFREDAYNQAMMVELAHFGPILSSALQVGVLAEKNTLLGSRGAGALRMANGAQTSFIGSRITYDISQNSSLNFEGQLSYTNVDQADGSLFLSVDNFAASQWQVSYSHTGFFSDDDSAVLRIGQPLRVENAAAVIEQSIALDPITGDTQYRQHELSLSPSGRELALEAGWQKQVTWLGQSWQLEANLAQRFDAGHFKGRHDTAAMMRVRIEF